MRKYNITLLFLVISLFVLITEPGYSQNISGFQYISPLPNSLYVSINSNIIIRQGNTIDKSSVNVNLIEVIGEKSGEHSGKVILANDSRTLIFKLAVPFETNEDVTVKLKDGLATTNGIDAGQLVFKFHTSINANTKIPGTDQTAYKSINSKSANIINKLSSAQIPDSALPAGLPKILIDTSNKPAPGCFFLSASPYLEITDNKGTPVFYRYAYGSVYDFKLQPTGELTYFIYPISCFGLDSSYNQVQTFTTADSFSVDVHDLRVLPDGNYYIFGKRNVNINLAQYGDSTVADVIDGALQEFDASGNPIFLWDALDHYKITDLDGNDPNTRLNSSVLDFPHFNSVDFDSGGNLLISARNLDEITKVDRNTGEIIWRLGGKNNQFTFINDSFGFSRQHDVRRFSNGDISIFDNGTYHPTPLSSAVEYKLNETDTTATLVRRIYHNNIFTDTEGSVQEMSNGTRVISWGHNWNPVITEVEPNDSIAIDLSYQYFVDTYRAFKFNWETNLFTTNTDSLNFGYVAAGDSLTKQFTIYNPHNSADTLNEFYCSDSSFTTNVKVPVIIQPKDSLIVPVTFKPIGNGTFNVSFNVRYFGLYQGAQQMIARQVILTGTTGNVSSVNANNITPGRYVLFQNYPNPFNPSTTISYSIPSSSFVTIKVYDILGREITTLVNEEKPAGTYSVVFDASSIDGGLSSGIYFYSLQATGNSSDQFLDIKKLVLLK